MSKKLNICLLSAMTVFLIVLFMSCGNDDDPVGPDNNESPYTIPSTTKILPKEDTATIKDYDTTGTVILDDSSSYAKTVSVGDVIIGHDDEKAPYGFLRKITSKTVQGDTVLLVTEQATLTDAFESMNISETHSLRPSDVVYKKLFKGARYKSAQDDAQFVVELDCVLYDQDGDTLTTSDQIKLDGEYAFTAALFAKIDISWFKLKKFETGIETDQVVNINLTTNLQWEFENELEFKLAEFHLGAIPVSGVIWLMPTLTVKAYIQGDLTITLETGINYTQQLRYGFGWIDDEFYDIKESKKNFNYTPPQFTTEFNFEPGLSLNASCLLYGVAGPYISGKAGFHFQSVLSVDSCDMKMNFDLDAILYAAVGIECDILGLDYNKEFQLYTHPIGEWVYPLGGTGTIVINPEPNGISAPWSLAGPCSYSTSGTGDETLTSLDPGDYTITWGAVSGWIAPSNSTQTLIANETLTFSGTYVEEAGSGTVVIDPSPDILNAPWSLSGPDSYNASGTGDETLTELAPGDYMMTWGVVSGWVTPSNSTQTLAADETVTFSGSYIEEDGTVTDIDGNIYQTITIGTQVWMAENLKVTHYRNGDPIPNVTDAGAWGGLTTGAYCEYNNDENNVATYGRLYNWYTVNDSRNIAPTGWHVASDTEWQTLVDYLGGDAVAGGKMKEAGTTHWVSPNTGATNESGFSGLPGGFRLSNGFYYFMGGSAFFWSSTEYFSGFSDWYRLLNYNYSGVGRNIISNKQIGLSVRCVRD